MSSSRTVQPPSRRLPNFDRVARIYRWAEFLLLGPLLTRTREHFLPQLTSTTHALALGDGDGRFCAKLLTQNRTLRVTAVDLSAGMLRLLKARCERAGVADRLCLQQASFSDPLVGSNLYPVDLVVTHFALDCLTQPEIEALTQQLAVAVAPNCRWVLSEFAVPPRQPWRSLGRLYIRALYLAFRLLTGLEIQALPDPQQALRAAGFTRLARFERLNGLLYSELWTRNLNGNRRDEGPFRATLPQARTSTLG